MLREQKRALVGMIISGFMLIATLWFTFAVNPADIFASDDLEQLYLAFLLTGGAIYAVVYVLTRKETKDDAYVYDERDAIIANQALTVQLWSVIIALAIWCVTLVRLYIDKPGIPVPLMYLMFLSIIIINAFVRSVVIFFSHVSSTSNSKEE